MVRNRLAAATRTTATITVDFDPRDRRLAIAAQIDPAAAPATAAAIAAELARLRVEPPGADELDRARRHALAAALGAEIGVSGRARQLEAAVLANEPLTAPDRDLDALRTLTAEDVRAAARFSSTPPGSPSSFAARPASVPRSSPRFTSNVERASSELGQIEPGERALQPSRIARVPASN